MLGQFGLFALVCVSFIVGLVLSIEADKVRNHNPEDIVINLKSSREETKDNRFYVYMDFDIMNKSGAKIHSVSFKTHVEDKNGNSIGSITTTFGSPYFLSGSLELEKKNSITKTSYLDESLYSLQDNSLMHGIYENGLESYNLRIEITEVRWTDEYKWSK